MSLRNEHLTRQLDILPVSALGKRITIIGAGAVGGWTALALAKMGFSDLSVYDPDVVEVENLNAQIYGRAHIGAPKVAALKDIVRRHADTEIIVYNSFYEGMFAIPGIVISAVDSMAARKTIWRAHAGLGAGTEMILDPRMGAETAVLYVMNPMDQKDDDAYSKTLHSDQEAVQEPCTRKATAYCALALAGLVAAQVKSLAVGASYARITQWKIPEGAYQDWRKV